MTDLVLTLTAAGQQLRQAGVEVSAAIAQACAVSQAELADMMAGLDKLNRHLAR